MRFLNIQTIAAAVRAVKRRVQDEISRGIDLALSVTGMRLTSEKGVANISKVDVALLKALAMAGFQVDSACWKMEG